MLERVIALSSSVQKFLEIPASSVADNLFNPDPYYQQGGDMVRVGGLSYTCRPKSPMGKRISNLAILPSGDKIEPSKKYVVGGWGSINPDVEGPAIFELLENYISEKN